MRWAWFRARVWLFNLIGAVLLPGQRDQIRFTPARGGVKVR